MKNYDIVFLIYALRKKLIELQEKKDLLLTRPRTTPDLQKNLHQMNKEISEIEQHLKVVNQ